MCLTNRISNVEPNIFHLSVSLHQASSWDCCQMSPFINIWWKMQAFTPADEQRIQVDVLMLSQTRGWASGSCSSRIIWSLIFSQHMERTACESVNDSEVMFFNFVKDQIHSASSERNEWSEKFAKCAQWKLKETENWLKTETNFLNKDRKKQPETQRSKSLTLVLFGSWLHAWADNKSYFGSVANCQQWHEIRALFKQLQGAKLRTATSHRDT